MNNLERLENLIQQSNNQNTKKNLKLALSHLKLLYKYGIQNGHNFRYTNIPLGDRALSQLSLVNTYLIRVQKPYRDRKSVV